jgi:hypothetical protein
MEMQMKKLTVCTVLVVISMLLAACSATPVYTSDAGKFSVAIPAPLTEKVQSVSTLAGNIDQYLFTTTIAKITYMVAYSDYPPDSVKNDPQKVLDVAENDAVTNVNGVLLKAVKITLDNNPGYEMLIESTDANNQKMTTKIRMYLVSNRLYQILALANIGDADFNVIDPFLQSFKLLK